MGATPPAMVVDLVERFERDRKVFLSPDYKEEQLRAEFLNPFFESLGWDVSNKAGLTEVFKPVIHEESIKIAGATKAPDYAFRIGLNEMASSDASDSSDINSQSLWSLPSLLSVLSLLRSASGA